MRKTADAAPRSGAPAYQLIVRELLSEIREGRYRVGDRLGTEAALCRRFDVSRFTVRAALAQLESDGIVVRRPGIGIIVSSNTPQSSYSVSVGSLSELLVFLDSTIVKVVAREEVIATPERALDLGCTPGERWIRLQTLRTPERGKPPISWTEYWLRPRFKAIVTRIGSKPGPVYPLLIERFGVSIDDIEQDIGAIELPPDIAKSVAAKSKSAALRVIHRFVSRSDGILYCTISLYPADRFRYVQKLRGTARGSA
ncbi:MAG: GntR family transcriptional regulator [Burkholderiaceae bacterium]